MPADLATIVRRFLRKDPEARPKSARELIALLDAAREERSLPSESAPIATTPAFYERSFLPPFGRQAELSLLESALERSQLMYRSLHGSVEDEDGAASLSNSAAPADS